FACALRYYSQGPNRGRNGIFRTYSRSPGIVPEGQPPKAPSCPAHHRQPLNVCVQDCQLICGVCLTVGQHQGHPIDDLQAAFIRERQAPAHLLARLSDPRRAEVCELGEQDKASCEGLVRQDRQAVEQYFQGIARKKSFHGGLGHRKRGGVSGLRSTHWKLKELQSSG
uniref:B box-type domain-containing protein n=2 Tax=Oncorhynchus tshawytscha TaxID=74940 RepID=A0AAZ3NV96_ONCTS